MPLTIRPYRRFLPLVCGSSVWPIISVLLLSLGLVHAEWSLVDSSQSKGGYSVYVDVDAIARKEALVEMWYMLDFKAIQLKGEGFFVSQKVYRQFDCAERRTRLLAIKSLSDHMGAGEVVFSDVEEEGWVLVSPGSIGETLWEVACGKP